MRFVFCSLLGFLAMFAANSQAQAQTAFVKEMKLEFKTTTDDREGGVVEVEIWHNGKVVASHSVCEKPVWNKGNCSQITIPINRTMPCQGLTARIKLKDATECNIRWKFHATIELKNAFGTVASFVRNNAILDTTGRGRGRSDYLDINQ
jgi:hypothetical protein